MKTPRQKICLLIASAAIFTIVPSCSKEAKAERKLEAAQKYMAKGEYVAAEIELKSALDLKPGDVDIIRQLGLLWISQGATLDGVQALSFVRQKQPKDDEAGINFALGLLDLGFLGESRKVILSVLDHTPANGDAIMLLADTSMNLDLITECEDRIQVSNASEKAPFILASALLDLRRGLVVSGDRLVDQVLELDPKSARAHALKATIQRVNKEPEAAVEFAKKAAELGGPRSREIGTYATLLMELKRPDEAIALMKKATKEAPGYLPNWRMLANIAVSQERDSDASEYLSKVLSKSPLDIDAAMLQAQLSVKKGEPAKAVEILGKLSATFPSRPVIEFQLAKAYVAAGDSVKATHTLDQLLAMVPGATEATLLRTRLYLKDGQPGEAVRVLEPLVSANPTNRDAQDLLVGAYAATDRNEDAVKLLEQQMKMSTADPAPLLKMGLILRQEKKSVEAREAFEKALKIAPDDLNSISQLSMMDAEEDKLDAAMQRIDAFLAKHPESSEGYQVKAGISYTQKDFKAVESSLEKAIELKPDNVEAYGVLAKVLIDSGRSAEAVTKLEKILQAAPGSPAEYWLTLGTQLLGLGRNEEALACFLKLSEQYPDFGPAYNNLAYIQSELIVDLDQAAENARKARSLMPKDPMVADTLGAIESMRGNYTEALALLDEAVPSLPDMPVVRYHRGLTHYKMGHLEEAAADFEGAIGSDVQFPEKADATKRLEALRSGAADLPTLEQKAKENPDDVATQLQLAQALARAGRPDEALSAYDTALKANSKLVTAHLGKFRIYTHELKDPAKALEVAKQADRAAPNNREVMAALGTANYLTGNLEIAYGMLRDATSSNAGDTELLANFAMTAYGLGRIAEARTSMERAIKGGLADKEAANQFLTLTAVDRLQEPTTKALAEKVIAANPDDVPSLMLLAEADEQAGKNPEEKYRQILKIYPTFNPARKNLALILVKDPSKIEEAEALAVEARRRLTDDADLTSVVAIASHAKGKHSNAIQLLKEVASKRALNASEFYALGMSQVAAKEVDDARGSLNKALELGLGESEAQQAKAALAELEKEKSDD